MSEVTIHDARTAVDHATLKTLDLGSGRHFDCQHFAFYSRLAADRDHLSRFDLLHHDLVQQSKKSLSRGNDRDARMTSTTGHEYLAGTVTRPTAPNFNRSAESQGRCPRVKRAEMRFY
jgi:hypothetical protein